MPNGNLLIGKGYGPATEFDSTPAVQNYIGLLDQQRQKREKETSDLQAQLAKSSPVGIREPDRQGYMDKYAQLQAKGREKINERDPYKKAQLQAEIDKGLQDLGSYVDQSKQEGQQYHSIMNQMVTNKQFHDSLTDDSAQRLLKSASLSMDDPGYLKSSEFGGLERKPDLSKIGDKLDKLDKYIYDNTKYNTGIDGKPIDPLKERVTSGNKTGTIFTNQRVVDPAQQALHYGMEYDTDRDFKAYLKQQYPDYFSKNDEKTAKMLAVHQLVQDRPIQSREKPDNPTWDTPPQKPVRPTWIEEYFFKKTGKPFDPNSTKNQNQQPIYRQKLVGDILNGDTDGLREIKAKIDASPQFNGKSDVGHIVKGAQKGQIYIDIPSQGKYKDGEFSEDMPAHRVFIDPKADQADIRLNEIINNVTGEKVNISALKTPGGKGHVGRQNQNIAPDDFNKKWAQLPKGATLVGPDGVTYTKK